MLQRVKDISKLKIGGRKMNMPSLKKRDVETVLQQLQEMYECLCLFGQPCFPRDDQFHFESRLQM